MSDHVSLIPPNITPPDPPVAKMLALGFSIFMSFVLVIFIGFVGFEFLAEMLGHPLKFESPFPEHDLPFPLEHDSIDVFKSPWELITPKHQTLMQGPEVVVIYTCRLPDVPAMPPDLWVNGALHPWEIHYGNNTWFARLRLPEGFHRVQAGDSEAEFFVETSDTPNQPTEEWTRNRPHPDTNKIDHCYDCHETSGYVLTGDAAQRPAVGAWKGEPSCFVCHEIEEHQLRHATIKSTTNQCFRCHSMH